MPYTRSLRTRGGARSLLCGSDGGHDGNNGGDGELHFDYWVGLVVKRLDRVLGIIKYVRVVTSVS